LQADVPNSAIIAPLHGGYDYFGEAEYLINRHGLKADAIRVLKTVPQIQHFAKKAS
jgi:hypothetical protein